MTDLDSDPSSATDKLGTLGKLLNLFQTLSTNLRNDERKYVVRSTKVMYVMFFNHSKN